MGTETMDEFCACKRGFQSATGIMAQALLTQSVIVAVCVLIGIALI